VDPATGAFHLFRPSLSGLCVGSFDTLDGTVTSDGQTLTADHVFHLDQPQPDCWQYASDVTGVTGCGNGITDAGEACDDANRDAGDGCSPTCTVEPCWTCDTAAPSQCSVAVLPVCAHATNPGRAALHVSNVADAARDRVVARIPRTTTAPAFGDPPAETDYAICLFDGSGDLLFAAAAPHGGTCSGRPCWQAKRTGFKYRDRSATPDGLLRMSLAATAGTRAMGRGALLSGRPRGLPTVPLPLPLKLQVQGANGACFEADFTTATTNDPATGRFVAKGSS
jgi:cysteine-rich repeat protein